MGPGVPERHDDRIPALAHAADTRTFQTIFDSFYRGAFDAGLQVRLAHQSQLTEADPAEFAATRPVLVAAGLAITDTARWATDGSAVGGCRAASSSQPVTGAHSRDGRQLRFVHNWSWTPSEFVLPAAVTDVLGDEKFEAGDVLQLGAWDALVLVEG